MRFLDTETGIFTEWDTSGRSDYAILSHVWESEAEKNYDDILRLIRESQVSGVGIRHNLPPKIREFCRTACGAGLLLGWVDTCCIDRSNTEELELSIISMYEWYSNADTCYVYLHDVDIDDPHAKEFPRQFSRAKWFERGWTLQELLAPKKVVFLSSQWRLIGSRDEPAIAELIAARTGIDQGILKSSMSSENVPVSRKISWAANRTTTKPEDLAYLLIGALRVRDVKLTYGEGLQEAFRKIQERLLDTRPYDDTLFAWGRAFQDGSATFPKGLPQKRRFWRSLLPSYFSSPSDDHHVLPSSAINISPLKNCLLSPTPYEFASCPTSLHNLSPTEFAERLSMSSNDAELCLHPSDTDFKRPVFLLHSHKLVHDGRPGAVYAALLACEDSEKRMPALLLRPRTESSTEYVIGDTLAHSGDPYATLIENYVRIIYLLPEQISNLRRQKAFRVESVRVPLFPPSLARTSSETYAVPKDCPFEVRVSRGCIQMLKHGGYTINPEGNVNVGVGTLAESSTAGLTISNRQIYVRVRIGRCGCDHGRSAGTLGVLVIADQGQWPYASGYVNEQHRPEHPIHICSWKSIDGSVSHNFDIPSPHEGDSAATTTLRFSIRPVVTPTDPNLRVYQLDISASLAE